VRDEEEPLLQDQTSVDTFTDFVRRSEPGLRRALTAGFGSDVGREAASEALSYGWEHWERLQSMANPAAYVFRVGQNKARKQVKRSRWLSRDEIVFTEPWAEPGFGPAWSSLSDRQRAVVGLVHGFDWSLSEVADLLGISKGAVQTYEKRAMRRLRRDLGVEL
jgi:DNA-directed RNA polymerase specialized sigma24 family protein